MIHAFGLESVTRVDGTAAVMAYTDLMELNDIVEFLISRRSLLALTGAGVSTASGIPDYRDLQGDWKRRQPMDFQQFTGSHAARQRYWARSMLGWPRFAGARPNAAHMALAALERAVAMNCLITQNVDGLHQQAGSGNVIDLHGRLDRVVCLNCSSRQQRSQFQNELERLNPQWTADAVTMAPDGDADLQGADYRQFQLPACGHCGGVLKPDVVFFGENVPRTRVAAAQQALLECDGLLVVGSSLMVWSGFRFARAAAERGIPIVALNRGKTRADDLLWRKVDDDCLVSLKELLALVAPAEGSALPTPVMATAADNADPSPPESGIRS
ncbi:MAG: NAD-dependent protein deacetylase [Wenzhouxiangellaceae bacterium]